MPMIIYQILQEKDPVSRKWYKEWEVPEGLPLPAGFVSEGPPANMQFPRYSETTGLWIDDRESLVESLKDDIVKLKTKQEQQEEAFLNTIDLITGGGQG